MPHNVIWDTKAFTAHQVAGAAALSTCLHTGEADTNHLMIAYVTAVGVTSESSNAWISAAQFVTDSTPTTTRPFVAINIYRQREDAVWTVALTTDGTDICIELQGDAAEDTEWAVYAFMLQNHPH